MSKIRSSRSGRVVVDEQEGRGGSTAYQPLKLPRITFYAQPLVGTKTEPEIAVCESGLAIYISEGAT